MTKGKDSRDIVSFNSVEVHVKNETDSDIGVIEQKCPYQTTNPQRIRSELHQRVQKIAKIVRDEDRTDKENRVAIAQAIRTDVDGSASNELLYINPGDLGDTYKKFKEVAPDKQVEFIKEQYKKLRQKLHPLMEELISDYLSDPKLKLDDSLKVPGMHAEVFAVNKTLWQIGEKATREDLKNISVATIKLQPARNRKTKRKSKIKQLDDFTACVNCTGILHRGGVHVITGVYGEKS